MIIEPFTTQHRLCQYFPYVEFKFDNGEKFFARPSFSFPFVKPPNMIPNVDESLFLYEFGPSKTEYIVPSPQALWIKLIDMKNIDCKPLQKGRSRRVKEQNQQNYQFTDTLMLNSQSLLSHTNTTLNSMALSNANQLEQVGVPNMDDLLSKRNGDIVGKDIDEEVIGCSINSSKFNRLQQVSSGRDLYQGSSLSK